MLALIAPEELRISARRVTRFVDAYIGLSIRFAMTASLSFVLILELLTRRRLHAYSAYLRKYCQLDDINQATLV